MRVYPDRSVCQAKLINMLINPERKQAILDDAKTRILEGETIEQIAHSYSISRQTLNTWLMALGEEYQELRQVWIDNMLSEAKESIDSATESIDIARARESWKAATWIAERRDRLRYGQQVANINIINGITMTDALSGTAGELLEHIDNTD